MLVSKWGNSLAVRLPKELVEALHLAAGDELIIVDASKEKVAVEKADRRKVAIEELKSMNWRLPPDYKFNRDEANER